MKPTSLETGIALLQEKGLYLHASKEERKTRREELALKARTELSLRELCFLFLYALEKMLGDLDSPEVIRYFEGLELIGYPYEFLATISTGNSYPIAELSEYLDSHKYEIYQLRQQVQILQSIDNSLKQLAQLSDTSSVKAQLTAKLINLTDPFAPYADADGNVDVDALNKAGLENWTKEEEEKIKKKQDSMIRMADSSKDLKESIGSSSTPLTLAERLKARSNG